MSGRTYLTHIQGLRGLAIFLIVLFHLMPGICPNGFLGVDVFFVISGYFLLRRAGEENTGFRLLPYLRHKAERILPPYLVTLIAVVPACVILFPADDMLSAAQLLKSCLLGQSNQYLQERAADYFAADTRAMPLMHLWYMGVILQAYLLFGLLSALWERRCASRRARLLSLALIGAVSFAAAHLFAAERFGYFCGSTYYTTLSRLWEFVLGGLLAQLPAPQNPGKSALTAAVALAILLLFSFLPLAHGERYVAIGAFAGAVLIRYGQYGCLRSLLSSRLLTGLGAVSFSLYLVHWPWICFAEYTHLGKGMLPLSTLGIVLGGILLSTLLLYHLVEKPAYPLRRCLLYYVAAASCWVLLTATDGFRTTLHGEANKVCAAISRPDKVAKDSPLRQHTEGLYQRQLLKFRAPSSLLRAIGDTSKPCNFVILGDSHAEDFAAAMNTVGKEEGWHGAYLNSYIVPFWGSDYPTLENPDTAEGHWFDRDKAQALCRWLTRNPELKTVFLVQYWSARYESHRTWDGKTVSGKENIRQARAQQLREMCLALREAGKHVVLVCDCPTISCGFPQREVQRHLLRGVRPDGLDTLCCFRTEYEAENADIHRAMQDSEADGLCDVLHREENFFPPDRLSAYAYPDLLFRDRHHLTEKGALMSISRQRAMLRALLCPASE